MSEMETSVTIKYKAGHDSTWAVFRGAVDEVRQQIIRYFGIPDEVTAGMSSHEVATYATEVAQGKRRIQTTVDMGSAPTTEQAVANVQQHLGGEVVSDTDSGSVWSGNSEPSPSEQEPAGPDHSGLIAALQAAPSIDELKKLYALNRPAFEETAVMDAYKTRGKALKEAT